MPHADRHVVCRLEEIPDPGARGFSLPGAHFPDEYFLVRRGAGVHAYRNHCPHTGRFLNWKPDAFLTRDLTLIMCSGHGALFEPESGRCVAGPCLGQGLAVLRAEVEGGEVVVYPSAEAGQI
jgi:nitrite reductase/ring-hydroxylating ferredoxin subunit